jgi:energy-coupling factor transporter ATP-binding protein EcfA2
MAHTYILGKSGGGKSTLLKQLALNDILNGNAVCFVDPHGLDTDDLLNYVPRKRLKDTILFDPTDPDFTINWNPLQETDNVPLLASTITDTVRGAWKMGRMNTPNVEMMVQSLIYTALEFDLTFYDCLFVLKRNDVFDRKAVRNPVLDLFWTDYYGKTRRDQDAFNSSTFNKLYSLLLDPRMQQLFGHLKGQFYVSEAVKNKVLFIRLPQGHLGLGKVALLASLLLAQIHLASLRRDPAIPLSIYIDEVHHIAPSILTEMISGLRKFNVHITVAHQNIAQLDKELFASLLGNCDTRHLFRVSPEDAREFQECTKNGPICLDELPSYTYRTFPWTTHDKDGQTAPLALPENYNKSSNMPERIKHHTHVNYCRPVG